MKIRIGDNGRAGACLRFLNVTAAWVLFAVAATAQIIPGRYFVELSEPVADKTAAGVARARAAQIPMRARLAAAGAEVRAGLVATTNGMIVNLPVDHEQEMVQELGGMPGIKRLVPMRRATIAMDAAPDVLGAVNAWRNYGGQERAGLGVKIGIIDTGIDQTHPAFQDNTLRPPAGYPNPLGTRSGQAFLSFTNNKVIVARSYVHLYNSRAADQTPSDRNGHGTSVAMAAAAVLHDTPRGKASGMAPKAFLGNYRASAPGAEGSFDGDIVMMAFDDAVADGMDVISLSLGSTLALRPEDDPFTDMVNEAAAKGIVVVVAAGNQGPDAVTVGDFAQPPLAISVGATRHARIESATVAIAGSASLAARLGSNTPATRASLTANVTDVATLDGTGEACGALPSGRLAGAVALIVRGNCFFEDKINHAAAAGARAVVIYTASPADDAFEFGAGTGTLPAVMVSHEDGLHLKALAGSGSVQVTLDFALKPALQNHRKLSSFSSIGPGTSFAIKPDLVTIGEDVYTAVAGGGYKTSTGTSIAAPMVAGTVAFLKSIRPGLTVENYRSLVINTAQWMEETLQKRGNGSMFVDQAANSTIAAAPATVSFGISGVNANAGRTLTLTNLGREQQTFTVTVFPLSGGPVPTVSDATVTLAPGASRTLSLRFQATGLPGGERNGLFIVRSTASGEQIFVPYWHGVPTNVPSRISVLYADESGAPSSTQFIYFRMLDEAGMPAIGPVPTVTAAGTATAAGATVSRLRSFDILSPGLWEAQVRLPSTRGNANFTIHSDGAPEQTVTIAAE